MRSVAAAQGGDAPLLSPAEAMSGALYPTTRDLELLERVRRRPQGCSGAGASLTGGDWAWFMWSRAA